MAATTTTTGQLDETNAQSISLAMSSSSQGIVSGRARSCTGCRQVKLACNARQTAPQPCSRCKTKGLHCKFDSNFKRIPTRRIAQEITNELHKLRPSAATTPSVSSPSRHSINAGSSRSVPTGTPSEQQMDDPGPGTPQQWLQVADSDYYLNYGIGTVELDPQTIVALFQHFERYHLRHAHFLNPIQSLSTLARSFPLLFWTIILITTREHENYEGLYEQISVAHGVLVSQILNSAIQHIEDIHSLLLLCLWPIPRRRGQYDPSWNYIGLATNAAVQINCHRPLAKDHIAREWKGMGDASINDIGSEAAALTWIYCFQIGAKLAAVQGFPPPIATSMQLKSISSAVSVITSSSNQEQQVTAEILKLSCRSTVELDYAEDPHARHSMAQMFDGQFDEIAQSYKNCWSPEIDIQFAAAKLNLYGLTFIVDTDRIRDAQQLLINRQLVLRRGLDTAMSLISKMTLLSNTAVDQGYYPAGALSFYPKYYFFQLHTAATFLFRFLASYRGVSQLETTLAISGLTEAHKIFQSFPDHRDSMKAAHNIEMLVDILRSPQRSHPYPLDELVIQTRLGASMVFDASFRISHHRNKNPVTHASPPSISNWLSVDDDPRLRLPLTPEQRATSSSGPSSNPGADDGQPIQSQTVGPWWTEWDTYMNDFEVGLETWNTNVVGQTPMDQGIQGQMYDTANLSALPIMGHQYSPGGQPK